MQLYDGRFRSSIDPPTVEGPTCSSTVHVSSLLSMNTGTRKALRGTLGILAFTALSLAGAAINQDIRATVDGNLVDFPDVQPIMINSRVMVPVRGVFEHMNATVVWDADKKTVTADRGSDSILLTLNSYNAMVNGRQVDLDSPAVDYQNRTMVPLRFLSEALKSSVEWVSADRTVVIDSTNGESKPTPPAYTLMRLEAGTVIPFKLTERLTSKDSAVGDHFTATLDPISSPTYQGMAAGAVLHGHVDVARPKTGDTPGVLGLAFDRVQLLDGQDYPVFGSLIGLDAKSIDNDNGRLVAKPGTRNDSLKYVGYGAGGGALVALLTRGNILTDALIGGALGFLLGETQKDPKQSRDVNLAPGTQFGVKLDREFTFRVPVQIRR